VIVVQVTKFHSCRNNVETKSCISR